MTELRAKARKSGVYLRVLKNTLARRAVEGTPFAGLSQHMTGPLVYGISPDPVAGAKVLNEFAKANEKLVIRAGAMENAVISAKEVTALAAMPSRERSEERRVGKECRSRWARDHEKKKRNRRGIERKIS